MNSMITETQSIKEAVVYINSIDNSKFSRLLSRVLHKLHLKAERSFSEEEEEKLQSALCLEKETLKLVLETVSFIFEQAVYHSVKPASLKQQLENIKIVSDKAQAFSQIWAAAGPDELEKIRQRIFAPKTLVQVGWQLNLQMGRSAQSKLKAPHAVLDLGLRAEDGTELEDVFVEFDHQELLDFYNKMEEIQTQLDSLS
ncbi:COMM domain-containing protein 10 isoform X2 [Misgurnus anguillicaudatus]|uniref:COMM domain-containing protein 10 isoform X2 n=1 Tax=Misgurnus anguillicaudatus TaxID=75329 RepID=UPI0024348000|nr:COMM domain-containing protein 10 isoform X2 [Misgurnus anguillicaudatus]